MPTIQIADKPTLDAVKTDTTAILNKSNANGTAISNLSTSVTNGFNGTTNKLTGITNTINSVQGNTTSSFVSTGHNIISSAASFTTPEPLGTAFTVNGNRTERHHSPVGFPFYSTDNTQIDIGLALSKSGYRSDDDFLYFAVNCHYYRASEYGGADSRQIYIHIFDGIGWHIAPLRNLVTELNENSASSATVNLFPICIGHKLIMYVRDPNKNLKTIGNYYYILDPVEKNGIPVEYIHHKIDVYSDAAHLSWPGAVFIPSPIGKTSLTAPDGQYAWYGLIFSGGYPASTDASVPPATGGTLNLGTNDPGIIVVGMQSVDSSQPASKTRLSYVHSIHAGYDGNNTNQLGFMDNRGCHKTTTPWFYFERYATTSMPNILVKFRTSNTGVSIEKVVTNIINHQGFKVPSNSSIMNYNANMRYITAGNVKYPRGMPIEHIRDTETAIFMDTANDVPALRITNSGMYLLGSDNIAAAENVSANNQFHILPKGYLREGLFMPQDEVFLIGRKAYWLSTQENDVNIMSAIYRSVTYLGEI